jgi:imidazolonepropionase-like amidohydrolase
MKYAYINGIILDGSENMEPQKGMAVLTEDDTIRAILPSDGLDLTGYEKVDLRGQYLMPGLINLHVHLPATGKPKKKETDSVKLVRLMTSTGLMRRILQSMCENSAKTQLMSGVTTIRTMGGVEDYDSRIRNRIDRGEIPGPRILAGNMAVSVPGGHMAGSLAYMAHSAEEARDYVKKIAEGKPDLIKLMITGGVLDAKKKGEPGELKMPAEYVKAACEEAHRRGMKVAAHVESPEGVRTALINGVDTIEHGAEPDEEILRLFRERGACQVATISPALPFALFDPAVSHATEMAQYNGKIVFDGIISCAKACLANQIPVGLGTDTGCPFITHYDMWREVFYFHKYCGVSPAFALYTATKRNAELAGLGEVTGSIEAGKCADLIVTKKNPLEDLTALRTVTMVVARGKQIANPKVKKMPQVEAELDKFL